MVKRYLRIRQRDPKRFIKSSFRTQDIGRKGHSYRIAGKLKRTGRFATQSFRILKSDAMKSGGVKKTLLGRALLRRGKITKKGRDYRYSLY